MSRKNNNYSKELKLKIVKEYFDTNLSQNKLADKYQIKSKSQIATWVKKYKVDGDKAFDIDGRGRSKSPIKGRPKTKFKSLEEENKYLKMQVDYLKKLTDWERW